MKTSGFQGHELVQPGRFVVGCNYWASHAGTRMWEDWRPDIVTRDLRRLEQGGGFRSCACSPCGRISSR